MSRKHLLIGIIKLETIKMSEPSVNIVKLAVGVKSVEELALIQRQFLSQRGTLANNGFYHSTKILSVSNAVVQLHSFCKQVEVQEFSEPYVS